MSSEIRPLPLWRSHYRTAAVLFAVASLLLLAASLELWNGRRLRSRVESTSASSQATT